MSRVPSKQPAIQTERCALGFSGEPLCRHSTPSRVFALSKAHFSPPPPPLTRIPTCRLSPLCSSLLPPPSSDKLGCNSLGSLRSVHINRWGCLGINRTQRRRGGGGRSHHNQQNSDDPSVEALCSRLLKPLPSDEGSGGGVERGRTKIEATLFLVFQYVGRR